MNFEQLMIPSLKWNDEYWNIEIGKDIKEIKNRIRYYSGNIPNLVLKIEEFNKEDEKVLFETYSWIDKVMIIQNEDIKAVFKRK